MSEFALRRSDTFEICLEAFNFVTTQLKLTVTFPNEKYELLRLLRYSEMLLSRIGPNGLPEDQQDLVKDIQPLVCLYYTLRQASLLECVHRKLTEDLQLWRQSLEPLVQHMSNIDEFPVAPVLMREMHQFMMFAVFTNRIHPEHEMTSETLRKCVSKANQLSDHGLYHGEKKALERLIRAFLLAGVKTGEYMTPKHVELFSTQGLQSMEWWYSKYSNRGIPFENLWAWYLFSTREVKVASVASLVASPVVAAIVGRYFGDDSAELEKGD